MFSKNVPAGERVLRGIVAVVLIGTGVWWAFVEPVWGVVVAASGAGLGVSAVSGWCPVCAAVGRTLPEVDKKVTIARL